MDCAITLDYNEEECYFYQLVCHHFPDQTAVDASNAALHQERSLAERQYWDEPSPQTWQLRLQRQRAYYRLP